MSLPNPILYISFDDNKIENKVDGKEFSIVGDIKFVPGKKGTGITPGSQTRTSSSSNYVEISKDYFNKNQFTLCFWTFIKNTDGIIENEVAGSIIDNYNSSHDQELLQIGLYMKNDVLNFNSTYWDRNKINTPQYLSFLPKLNKWYFVCFQVDKINNEQTLFINGKKIQTIKNSAISGDLSENPRIFGWYYNGSTNNETNASAIIDEIYVFDKILTNDEILELYNEYNNCFNVVVKEISPNIHISTSGYFASDIIYTDYQLVNQTENNFVISSDYYQYADVFIQGYDLTVNAKNYGTGIVYFLKQTQGTKFEITGNINNIYIVYHNGYWEDINC